MALIRQGILGQDLNLGYGTDTIVADSGGSLVGNKIGIHTLLGNAYVNASDFSGGDFGAQVNAAVLNVSTGGVVDARNFVSGSFSTTITINKAVHLILPKSTMTFTGANRAIDISADNVGISGQGWDSILKMGAAVPLIRINNTSNITLRDFRLDGASRGFATSGITIGSSLGVTSLVQMSRLYFLSIQGSAITLAATEEFDDWELLFSLISDCGTASLPALGLAGVVDTARLMGNQWEGFIGTGITAGTAVKRVRVMGDKFHGDTSTNTNIALDWSGTHSEFIGNQFNFIQGTDQILVKNVDNSFIGNEHTDGAAATNTYNLSSFGSRTRIIANEITGAVDSSLASVAHTGTHILLASVADCMIAENIIRNSSASASSKSVAETGSSDRNDVHNNLTVNAGTVETIVGTASLFSNNGIPTTYQTRARSIIFTSAAPTVAAAQVSFGSTTAATATVGTGEAMKANVEGYLIVNVAGTAYKVPYVKT